MHESERLSPHGLRAGFITEAYLRGALDEQVSWEVEARESRVSRAVIIDLQRLRSGLSAAANAQATLTARQAKPGVTLERRQCLVVDAIDSGWGEPKFESQ